MIWFSEMDYFSQIWNPKTIGLRQILDLGDFPRKLVFWGLIWSNSTKKIVTGRKKKVFFGQIDYTLLISKFNKGICFPLCVIDIFSKYEWVIPLKDKKAVELLMLFKQF